MPQWSPRLYGALQDHSSPVAARGPGIQQWPLGSTKPCCTTLGPWDNAAQQCYSDVLGSTKPPQCYHGLCKEKQVTFCSLISRKEKNAK